MNKFINIIRNNACSSSSDSSSSKLSKKFIYNLLHHIGDNPDREELSDTPMRIVKGWEEIYSGYKANPKDILSKTFPNHGYDDIVICKGIEFYSVCEHHLQPIKGVVHIGYIPDDLIVGLSKLARVVECFCRRLQVQERLTTSISDSINEYLKPKGVGVLIEATHFCMCARGVGKQGSSMVTSHFHGELKNKDAVQNRFLRMIGY